MSCNLNILDQPDLQTELRSQESPLSAYHKSGLLSWEHLYQFHIEKFKDITCIFAESDLGVFQYLPPLGRSIDDDVVHKCFQYMERVNGQEGITRIENVSYKQLEFFSNDKYFSYLKTQEYLYFKDDLVNLIGNEYKSKRASFNHFKNKFTGDYCPYHDSMADECLALYDKWRASRREYKDDVYQHMLDENRDAHHFVLKNAKELGLIGRVIKVDGCIVAYTFGYELTKQVFCIAYEIANLSFQGLATFIFREFCNDTELREYKFINTMDDCGCENMTASKMSYRPMCLLPVYTITKKR